MKHIPITHLHGEFDTHDYGSDPTLVNLRRCSEKIKIVTDDLDDSPQFNRVADDLWAAEEIYFVGFGYDEKNLVRLPIESKYPLYSPGERMGKSRPRLKIFGSGYKLPPGIADRVKNYFKSKGFQIQLGDPGVDAFQFLRTTIWFGS